MRLLIKDANLISMADINYKNVDILCEDGLIKEIGNGLNSEDCKIIDAKNRYVTPGFVDPHCHIGIFEEGIKFEGDDVNEMTSPNTSDLRGLDAVYPFDIAFKDALEDGGVTTVCTGPGSANVIGGTFTIMKTYGKSLSDMVLVEESSMKMALGENPKRFYSAKNQLPSTRMGSAAVMREALSSAKEYYEKQIAYEKSGSDKPAFNFKDKSLSRVFKGLPVKIHAHRSDDITTALRIGEEFNLNFTIDHCSEGHLMAKELHDKNQRVIIGPLLSSRSKYELRNKTFEIGKVLEQENVEFALMTDHPIVPIEETRVQAAILVREGLSEMGALKAITINAAKLNNIDHLVGSIEKGKHADIIIWSGHPFEYMTKTKTVIVNGNIVFNR